MIAIRDDDYRLSVVRPLRTDDESAELNRLGDDLAKHAGPRPTVPPAAPVPPEHADIDWRSTLRTAQLSGAVYVAVSDPLRLDQWTPAWGVAIVRPLDAERAELVAHHVAGIGFDEAETARAVLENLARQWATEHGLTLGKQRVDKVPRTVYDDVVVFEPV